MKAGFGWELGPFEIWNEVGIENGIKIMQESKLVVPDWISNLSKNKINCFYKNENGKKLSARRRAKVATPLCMSDGCIL